MPIQCRGCCSFEGENLTWLIKLVNSLSLLLLLGVWPQFEDLCSKKNELVIRVGLVNG